MMWCSLFSIITIVIFDLLHVSTSISVLFILVISVFFFFFILFTVDLFDISCLVDVFIVLVLILFLFNLLHISSLIHLLIFVHFPFIYTTIIFSNFLQVSNLTHIVILRLSSFSVLLFQVLFLIIPIFRILCGILFKILFVNTILYLRFFFLVLFALIIVRIVVISHVIAAVVVIPVVVVVRHDAPGIFGSEPGGGKSGANECEDMTIDPMAWRRRLGVTNRYKHMSIIAEMEQ